MRGTGLLLAWWPLLAATVLSPALVSPLQAQSAPEATAPQGQELSEKEKALLQKINALKAPRWRAFGPCRYDWSGWKLMSDGVRTTSLQCGPETSPPVSEEAVAVHCDTLKLSVRRGDQPWSAWRLPYAEAESKERGGEDRMVASLCANAKPLPKPEPSTPRTVPPAAVPAKTTAPAKR